MQGDYGHTRKGHYEPKKGHYKIEKLVKNPWTFSGHFQMATFCYHFRVTKKSPKKTAKNHFQMKYGNNRF